MVAAVDATPVGVDVEEINPVDLSISEHYFTKDEHTDLMSHPDKTNYFYTLWTLKESYIKILGKGLSHPLDAFSVKFENKDQIVIKEAGRKLDNVCFAEYDIHKDYKTVLCASHKNLPKDIRMESTESIIRQFTTH